MQSVLLTAVANRQYEQALEYLETHPEEVTETDASGRTALQRLCQETNPGDAGVALAQAMVDIRPELITDDLADNKTLLNETVSRSRSGVPRSTDLALVLIRADPKCVRVRQGPWKYTPFHIACDADADIVVLHAMLQACPDLAANMTKNYRTPMEILLRRNGWEIDGPALEKVALILLTNFKGRVEDPLPIHQLVHAVCCYPRPLTFLTRIMKLFPEQVSQPDHDGFLPLHYAVKNVGVWDNSEEPFVHSNFVFQKLMKVVRAAPQALMTLDPSDGLYPVLMSAVRADQCTIHLSVTYQLLLAAPQIMTHAIPNDENAMHT